MTRKQKAALLRLIRTESRIIDEIAHSASTASRRGIARRAAADQTISELRSIAHEIRNTFQFKHCS